ncbi:unnamed protein product [Caenorhabditis angaria]|uniref:SPK domain-containing protein n=1 Tax=Caenorhabditis angaria TaxID=860376 RepID=A0A9P1IDV8_9PELO|nr:unnamed protein product [Caenorhabditis angaria]
MNTSFQDKGRIKSIPPHINKIMELDTDESMDSSDVLLLKNENIIWNYIFNSIVLKKKENVVDVAFFVQFLKSNILPDIEPDELFEHYQNVMVPNLYRSEIEAAKKLNLIKHLDVLINDNGKLFIERSITLKSIKWHKNRLINFEFVPPPIQKQSNVETLVKRAQELESKFVDFITKRSDIPVEQFDQIWLWNLFASIYNIDSTIDIQPAFAVFLNRLWFQPIEVDIKLKFMRYFKIKIDFIMKDFLTSYHDVNITLDDDNKIIGWTHMIDQRNFEETFDHSTIVLPKSILSSTLKSNSENEEKLACYQPSKILNEFGETLDEDGSESFMSKTIRNVNKVAWQKIRAMISNRKNMSTNLEKRKHKHHRIRWRTPKIQLC